MHSKQTVRYICERYPSGSVYYYKQEIITHGSWNDLSSLAWSRPRPVCRRTYEKRRLQGYRCEDIYINKSPAEVIDFCDEKKARQS
ncbi:hypothetical protein [Texcoconibacillus texcoconensis]|uniref:Uncharacterized protein n=1 Tax=Texcoconibacillus texcoconensis TaxID=1095777 RepID=A0A840QNU8_9BACI|nr:hypothetical protein [Texcoconibacillus texcoconensis]MBB5173013.1 hypothetical protein [Texcoconibacillus texcoconensis]